MYTLIIEHYDDGDFSYILPKHKADEMDMPANYERRDFATLYEAVKLSEELEEKKNV
jgi:hypothetical protein